jgi:septal ring factor EnvC (AmiA/AmiB activator)
MSDQAASDTKGNSKPYTNILMITALLALCAAAGRYGYHLGLHSAGEKYQDQINLLSAKSAKSDAMLAEQSAENISLKNQVTQLAAADKTHQAKLDEYANQIAALNERAEAANSCNFAKDQVVSLQNQLDLNEVLIPGQPPQRMYDYSREVATDRLKTYQAILEKCAH